MCSFCYLLIHFYFLCGTVAIVILALPAGVRGMYSVPRISSVVEMLLITCENGVYTGYVFFKV